MSSDDYFVATDLNALRMENELLTLENTYLKGRIAALELDLKTARERESSAREELKRAADAAKQPE